MREIHPRFLLYVKGNYGAIRKFSEMRRKSLQVEERIYKLYQTFNEVNSKYLFMYNATIKRYDVQLQRHESVSKCGDAKVGWGLDIIMALIQSDNWNWWQVTGAQSHLLHIFVADNLHNLAENQGIWYRNTTASCKMANFVTENARNGQTCIYTYISKVSRVVFVIVVCAWNSRREWAVLGFCLDR